MSPRLVWERDGADWPHHAASRFVQAGGVRWHVQLLGQGPVALLLHGTGASTHSWRDLAPLLALHFTVVMIDLPGHAFSSMPATPQMTLPGMARATGELMDALGMAPALIVGHSAGAAVAVQMVLERHAQAQAIVSLNGALLPLGGAAGRLFSPVAKLLALNPLVPRLVSWRAQDAAAVARLIDGTGSQIDAAGTRLYGRLVGNPGHVAGALSMMANWDLDALQPRLAQLTLPMLLVIGEKDRTLPPAQAEQVARRLPDARVLHLPQLGHLAHEEQPGRVADAVLEFARETGLSRG